MPFNEQQRGALVDYFRILDFSYNELDPKVEIYRFNEGFGRKNPYVLIGFLPTNRKKFQSLGDVLGKAQGRFYDYGYCHLEVVTVSVYCNEYHSYSNSIRINGRDLCYFIAETCLNGVLTDWEEMLKACGASLDRKDTIPLIKDNSGYDRETETKIYNYAFDVLCRTQLRWNKIPKDYEEDTDIAEKLEMYIDQDGNKNLTKIIRIDVS